VRVYGIDALIVNVLQL